MFSVQWGSLSDACRTAHRHKNSSLYQSGVHDLLPPNVLPEEAHREQGDQNGDISQKNMTQMDVPADAATTCSGQWRRDARVLGSLPFAHQGRWAPSPLCTDATHAVCGSTSFCGSCLVAVRSLSLWVASPGVLSQPPCVTWLVSVSPPLQRCPPLPGGRRPLTHSPRRGGSQRACQHGVCPPPRLLGDLRWQLRRSLFGMPAGSESSPFRMVGSWVAALQTQTVALFTQSYPADFEVTLLQRGCISGF